jgi:hypothetical protein
MSKFRPVSLILFVIFAVLSAITVLAAMDFARKHRPKHARPSRGITFPYRVIDSNPGRDQLYAYILHRGDDRDDPFPRYSAVIRHMDLERDDYKTYCKLVIHDGVKSMGSDKIRISIYDDEQTWELAEIKWKENFRTLEKPEQDTVDRHAVASYSGGIRDDEYTHRLNFFPDAKNSYTSNEIYFP